MMGSIRFLYSILLAAMVAITASCQKVIDLKTDTSAPQIVIEANVTNARGVQYVLISQSVSLKNNDNFPGVKGAQVTVKDSYGRTYNFKEDSAGVYSCYPMAGMPGATYTLTVTSGGQTYTATSTMPALVNLDSLTTEAAILSNSNERTIVVNFQDPAKEANQYHFLLYVNSLPVGAVFVMDDSFVDGRYVKNELIQNSVNIHRGDTVSVEMQCIDRNMYEYWYTLSNQQTEGPGGGTTPANPPSNLSNNALGYFSAHTTQTKTIIAN